MNPGRWGRPSEWELVDTVRCTHSSLAVVEQDLERVRADGGALVEREVHQN